MVNLFDLACPSNNHHLSGHLDPQRIVSCVNMAFCHPSGTCLRGSKNFAVDHLAVAANESMLIGSDASFHHRKVEEAEIERVTYCADLAAGSS